MAVRSHVRSAFRDSHLMASAYPSAYRSSINRPCIGANTEAYLALPEIRSCDAAEKRWELNECIEFHDVWFKYPKTDYAVLRGVSFKINKGETLAIVGRNGAGKSTIIVQPIY